jgi:RNA polymerase sigma factor (sigma-70 family)
MGLYHLLENAKQEDEESIVLILSKFYPAIKKMSKKLNYDEAETDIIIAFLEMIQKVELNKFYLKNDGAIVNYIYFLLKNKSADLFKKNVLQKIKTTELKLDIIADDAVTGTDNKVFVSMLINFLPRMQREVIKKKFIQGFSDKEIGFSLGISRQAVNRAKNRGLNNLRKKLEEMEGKEYWKKKYLS